MRILRSQYLQYQKSVTRTTTLTAYKKPENGVKQFPGEATALATAKTSSTKTIKTDGAGGGVQLIGSQRRHSVYIPALEPNGRATITVDTVKGENMRCQQRLLSVRPFCAGVAHAPPQGLQHQHHQPTLQLNFHNVSMTTSQQINIVLHFYEEEARWYTQIYRTYENLIWRRLPRGGSKKSLHWYFMCRVCEKLLCSFVTLKSHLNQHMEFYPHHCDHCTKKYPSRNSLTKHLRKFHSLSAMITQQ